MIILIESNSIKNILLHSNRIESNRNRKYRLKLFFQFCDSIMQSLNNISFMAIYLTSHCNARTSSDWQSWKRFWNADSGATSEIDKILRMRDSYKRFVKTGIRFANPWIRFANPWIRFVSWSRILTPKRFVSCLTKRILDSYRIVDHESWL